MKIDNSKASAVMTVKWTKPKASFFNALLRESNATDLIEEAYLIHGFEYKMGDDWHPTSMNRLSCKYPHHEIKNGKLVLSVPGVKAAYARAKQMHVYKGKVKEHLDRHLKELGLMDKDGVHYEEAMEEKFRFVESTIDSILGTHLVEEEDRLNEISITCAECVNLADPTGDKQRAYINSHPEMSITNDLSEYIDESSKSILNDINSPKELLEWMKQIKYGFKSCINDRVYINDECDNADFLSGYKLQSADQLIKSKVGVCFDQVELEREWFSTRGYGYKDFRTYMMVIDDGENKPSHTFLVYREDDKYIWFENSWYSQRGIHVYDGIEDIFRDAVTAHCKENENTQYPVYIFEYSLQYAGTTMKQFYANTTDTDDLKYTYDPKTKSEKVSNNIFPMSESVQAETESSLIEKKWFIRSDDGTNNCCIKVKGYDKPMRGRSSMILLKHEEDGTWYVCVKKFDQDDYSMPGGGWNPNETPEHAAIRELHEETQLKARDVKRMGTLIEYNNDAKKWVKDHVPDEKDWWYGYYSAIFVGLMNGYYAGKIKDEDKEDGYDFRPINDKLLKSLPKEYTDAINKYIKSIDFKESVETTHELEAWIESVVTSGWDSVFTEAEDEPPAIDESEGQGNIDNQDNNTEEKEGEDDGQRISSGATDNMSDDTDSGSGNIDDNVGTSPPEEKADEVEEDNNQQASSEPPVQTKTPISRPKQFAKQEQDKNGVRRKNLYIEFIRWAKEYNNKNIFGSNFDKDIFNGSYPFVPGEMRYFYRLADPTQCILAGGLTFFPVIQLRKLNAENKDLSKMIIFAATENDMRIFNNEDKRVYLAVEKDGNIVLTKTLANTFDDYIQTMIDRGDILNGPKVDTTLEYVEDEDI